MVSTSIDPMNDLPDRLKLLGDATRWRILQFLARPIRSCCSRDDGVCGCDLETYLGVSQPTISHHMKILADAGFVTAQRRGRWVYYELVPAGFRELAAALDDVAGAAEAAADAADTLDAADTSDAGTARDRARGPAAPA